MTAPVSHPTAQLGYVAEVRTSGVNKKAVDAESSVVLCNYTDIYYHDRITSDMDFMEATASASEIDRLSLQQGDVVITKDSETADDIGIPALVSEPLNGVVLGYHNALIRVDESKVEPRFAFWALASDYAAAYWEIKARGVTRVGLRSEDMAAFPMPFPSLEVQRRVADMLDAETTRIDTLINKTTQVLPVVDRRRTSALGRTLSVEGPLTPLRYLVAAPIGGVWGGDPGTSDIDVRVFRGADVDRVNHLLRGDPPVRSISSTEAASRLLQPGDILVEKSGGGEKTPVGVPAIVDDEALSAGPAVPSNFCARLVPNEIDATFLAQALSALYRSGATWPILRQSTGIQNLSLRDVLDLRIPKPSKKVQSDLAAEIQRQVSDCERIEVLIQRQIDLLETRRRSLITAAVTGQITV